MPARFRECTHMACFDLHTFVELNQRARKWQCPHCLGCYTLDSLIVDPFFNRITSGMSEFEEDVTEVEMKSDGSWRPKLDGGAACVEPWRLPGGSALTPLRLGIKRTQDGLWKISGTPPGHGAAEEGHQNTAMTGLIGDLSSDSVGMRVSVRDRDDEEETTSDADASWLREGHSTGAFPMSSAHATGGRGAAGATTSGSTRGWVPRRVQDGGGCTAAPSPQGSLAQLQGATVVELSDSESGGGSEEGDEDEPIANGLARAAGRAAKSKSRPPLPMPPRHLRQQAQQQEVPTHPRPQHPQQGQGPHGAASPSSWQEDYGLDPLGHPTSAAHLHEQVAPATGAAATAGGQHHFSTNFGSAPTLALFDDGRHAGDSSEPAAEGAHYGLTDELRPPASGAGVGEASNSHSREESSGAAWMGAGAANAHSPVARQQSPTSSFLGLLDTTNSLHESLPGDDDGYGEEGEEHGAASWLAMLPLAGDGGGSLAQQRSIFGFND